MFACVFAASMHMSPLQFFPCWASLQRTSALEITASNTLVAKNVVGFIPRKLHCYKGKQRKTRQQSKAV